MKLVLFAFGVMSLLTNAAMADALECRATSESVPPYAITVTCKADCDHIPKLPTVAELVEAGVDSGVAPSIVQIQSDFWRRACPNASRNSN